VEGVGILGENKLSNVLKTIGYVFVIFSLLFTITIGGFVLTNAEHLVRLIRVVQLINSEYLEPPTTEQLVDGATSGIVDSLGDPYSTYLTPEEYKQFIEAIEGKFGGIGIILSVKDPSKLVVLRPIKNTPAARAGIQAGDQIVKIDDVDTSTIDQDKAVLLMRGEPGTKVTLKIYRESTKQYHDFTLIREKITVPTVEGKILPGHPEIGYVDISQFSTETGNELYEVLKSINVERLKGLILDLRYNHGGELNAAVQVASYFVPQGPVVYIVDKDGNTDTRMATDHYLNIPLVVLVNEESASASEIVAGAIKDRGTGTLVGTKTFGKGIVQTLFELDSGRAVKLTTAKYLTPNKNDIHKRGIEPDVKVELKKGEEATISPTSTAFDSQLAKAVEVLKSKIGS